MTSQELAMMLYDDHIFERVIPFLEELSTEQLVAVLSTRDNNGKTVIKLFDGNATINEMAFPLLKKSPEHLAAVLSIADREGKMFLTKPDNVSNALWLFLEKMPREQFIPFFKTFLSIRDTEGKTFLQNFTILNQVISILTYLPFEERLALFSIEDKEGLLGSLHNPDGFEKAIPLLKKLSSWQLLAILSMREEDRTPLENPDIFKKAISLLEEQPPGVFADILELTRDKDSKKTLLHFPHFFKITIPILEKQPDKQLVDILSKQDKAGWTPLPAIDVFKNAVPFLEKMPHPRLLAVLSIKQESGLTLLHYADVFEKAIPFLKNLPPQQLVNILSIQDKLHRSLLHISSVFVKAIPLLQTLSSDHLVALLSNKNQQGETLLHFYHIFNKALPLFDGKLSVEQLKTLLFQKAGKYGDTPLHDPKILMLADKLIKSHSLDLSECVNSLGLTPLEMKAIPWTPSPTWITTSKCEADKQERKISIEDYPMRVKALQTNVEKLWTLAQEKLTPALLQVEKKAYTTDQILEALRLMIGRMEKKRHGWEHLKQRIRNLYMPFIARWWSILNLLLKSLRKQTILKKQLVILSALPQRNWKDAVPLPIKEKSNRNRCLLQGI